jgi:hypothetical protein
MELTLRGLIAIPTTRNSKGIDVLVSTDDGSATASLQVKTSQSRVAFWPMPDPATIPASGDLWFVFLRWLAKDSRFETFMASAASVKERVQTTLDRDLGRGLKHFPVWYLPKENPDEYAAAWESWSPDGEKRTRLI